MRREAEPKLRGTCANCDREVVAKCGRQRVWHWAHVGKLECDHWWEPETEWHRTWKSFFPREWQEISHTGDNGERHIADVKNEKGWVLEFQHSPIAAEERLSRESFYKPMVWVADGKRYKRDLAAFSAALAYGSIINDKPLTVSSPRMARSGYSNVGLLLTVRSSLILGMRSSPSQDCSVLSRSSGSFSCILGHERWSSLLPLVKALSVGLA